MTCWVPEAVTVAVTVEADGDAVDSWVVDDERDDEEELVGGDGVDEGRGDGVDEGRGEVEEVEAVLFPVAAA